MSFGEAISSVFSKYATFSGRARRSEYWYFYLFNVLISLAFYLLSFVINDVTFRLVLSGLSTLYSLAVLIPGLAVTVRRLHDIGKSGWNILIRYIPIVLLIISSVAMFVTQDIYYRRSFYSSYPGYSSSRPVFPVILFFVLLIVALAIAIMFLVWMCRDSQPGENQWGPNPKESNRDDIQ